MSPFMIIIRTTIAVKNNLRNDKELFPTFPFLQDFQQDAMQAREDLCGDWWVYLEFGFMLGFYSN
jgi:hypothetical protein